MSNDEAQSIRDYASKIAQTLRAIQGEDFEALLITAFEAVAANERGACAKIADSHAGAAKRARLAKGLRISAMFADEREEALAEERGESIASHEIAKSIRARSASQTTESADG